MSKAVSDETVAGKVLAARRPLRRTDWDGSDPALGHACDDEMARRLDELLDRVDP